MSTVARNWMPTETPTAKSPKPSECLTKIGMTGSGRPTHRNPMNRAAVRRIMRGSGGIAAVVSAAAVFGATAFDPDMQTPWGTPGRANRAAVGNQAEPVDAGSMKYVHDKDLRPERYISADQSFGVAGNVQRGTQRGRRSTSPTYPMHSSLRGRHAPRPVLQSGR
ncbi:protein of unknown function [Pararobbsia alpina]